MPYTLILAVTDEADLKLLLEVARRMGLNATSQEVAPELSEAEQQQLFDQLAGAWKDDVSGDEMIRDMYDSRTYEPRRDDEMKTLFNQPPTDSAAATHPKRGRLAAAPDESY